MSPKLNSRKLINNNSPPRFSSHEVVKNFSKLMDLEKGRNIVNFFRLSGTTLTEKFYRVLSQKLRSSSRPIRAMHFMENYSTRDKILTLWFFGYFTTITAQLASERDGRLAVIKKNLRELAEPKRCQSRNVPFIIIITFGLNSYGRTSKVDGTT